MNQGQGQGQGCYAQMDVLFFSLASATHTGTRPRRDLQLQYCTSVLNFGAKTRRELDSLTNKIVAHLEI